MLNGSLTLLVICFLLAAVGSTAHGREKGFLALDQADKLWNEFRESEEILKASKDSDDGDDDDGQADDESFEDQVSKLDPLEQGAKLANPPSSTACSCECCQVQKMLPNMFIHRPNGEVITSRCWKAQARPRPDSDDKQDDICPTTCQLSNDNQILTAAKGEVDYQRFCNYNCRPNTDAIGSSCSEFDSEFYHQAKTEGGNGKEVFPVPVYGIGSSFGYALAGPGGVKPGEEVVVAPTAAPGEVAILVPGAAPTPEAQAQAEKKARQQKVKIVYDMRKIVAERLRAETGANVAAAAAAAERVRANKWSTKKDADYLKKLRTKYDAISGKLDAAANGARAGIAKADEAERKTKKDEAEGRILAVTMVAQVRKAADEAIRKAVEGSPCSEQAAKDRAEAKGLDKPNNWVKVVAARAANPYQKAVTDAVQRTSEYNNLAQSTMDQAYAAQKQANTLIQHVNTLEAQGDVIGATIEKKQVTNLLDHARSLSAQAAKYYVTAQDTRKTVPKWQMAAQQAAAYAAWEYSNNAKAFR